MKKFTTLLSRKPKPNRKPRFFLQNLPKLTNREHFETVTTLDAMSHKGSSAPQRCSPHPPAGYNGMYHDQKTLCVSTLHKSSAVAEMGDRLATIDMGRKVEAAVSLFLRGEFGPPSSTMWPGIRPIYLRTKWQLDPASRLPVATTDMSQMQVGQVKICDF